MKKLLSAIILVLVTVSSYAQPGGGNLGDSSYAPPSGSIYLSRNQGDSWMRSDFGFPVDGIVNAFAVSGSRIVAGTEAHGIYISDDGAKNWFASNKGLPRGMRITTLVIHDNLIFAGTGTKGVYMSSDDGGSWKPASLGLDFSSVRCFHSIGNRLFAGTDNGIFSRQEDGSWIAVARGFQVNEFTSLNGDIFAATNFGAWRSSDFGRTWAHLWKNRTFFNIASSGNQLISFTSDDQVLASTNTGVSWARLDNNFSYHTFRITPASGSLLVSKWKNTFNSLRNNHEFRSEGLPQNKSFQNILVTPFGILVAVGGNSGC